VVDELVQRLRAPRPRRRPYGKPYFDANGASNLIAKTLELNGPNMVIDAACASSLVAISMGALALQHGQIDAALVGGASFAKCDSLILFSHAQSCSASGSRPFDEQADGLISSEGYVVLMIKTLERAEADGDTIHAVIRGVGMSSDGRGRSLWAPRKEGQFAALQRAYAGQLDPRRVQYLEAHATSTQVGDATELESLVEFFTPHAGGRKIPIGSVKSNLGHTLETAGVAGLLKLVLAMQHGQIPPSIHFREPNQTIDWTSVPFAVAERLQSWPEPEDGPRLGGVSAFGIGGLNVHVVVEQHRSSSNSLHVTEEPVDAVNVIRNAREHALAIVGRGVVMPGAHTVDAFARWLASSESAISDAPDTRWRSQSGVRAGEPQHWQTPTSRGGYILGYEYDWRRFKIPPKQIAQANPLQFMLLDAAQQALDEANFSAGHFDRSTTAVVVGTMFGGEFGNQLQVGLRLPELQRAFFEACHRRQIPQRTAAEWWDQYERNLLAAKPALLDETGSFTSSTLASRITKTLDLQGGALAIDAGEASSFAALAAASDLLRSGTCSLVLCAGAQHALDLVTYESLALDHRLLSDNGSGYLPGEGVGVVLLQRLVDAER
ncbi:MAG: hypothetical protein KDA60_22210, partial [Planctomycetales bacterium]|nr:hypothetical protein [Planctomycetales bacterium]